MTSSAKSDNKPKNGDDASREPTFEACTARLQKIVLDLEDGELPLERSLELFEEGIGIARAAQARLDRAERRVEELLDVDGDGRPVTREMDF